MNLRKDHYHTKKKLFFFLDASAERKENTPVPWNPVVLLFELSLRVRNLEPVYNQFLVKFWPVENSLTGVFLCENWTTKQCSLNQNQRIKTLSGESQMKRKKLNNQTLSATDVLAPITMKNAAKCDTSCELHSQRVIKTLNAPCTSLTRSMSVGVSVELSWASLLVDSLLWPLYLRLTVRWRDAKLDYKQVIWVD